MLVAVSPVFWPAFEWKGKGDNDGVKRSACVTLGAACVMPKQMSKRPELSWPKNYDDDDDDDDDDGEEPSARSLQWHSNSSFVADEVRAEPTC